MTSNAHFYNGFRNEVGSLSVDGPCRKDGKLVFTWKFHAVGGAEPIEVRVMAVQDDAGLAFKAVCPRLSSAHKDADINRLHSAVEADLMDQVFALSGIAWEDWYEVVVNGGNSAFDDRVHSAMGASLHVQVNRLKRGIHPKTGLPVTINRNNLVVPFPKPTAIAVEPEDGEEIEGLGKIRLREPDAERSYIPATSENHRALQAVLDRMALLRNSLADVLSQDKVVAQLGAIDPLKLSLLSGPSGSTS